MLEINDDGSCLVQLDPPEEPEPAAAEAEVDVDVSPELRNVFSTAIKYGVTSRSSVVSMVKDIKKGKFTEEHHLKMWGERNAAYEAKNDLQAAAAEEAAAVEEDAAEEVAAHYCARLSSFVGCMQQSAE